MSTIIGNNIFKFRKYKNLTQKELADKIGRTPAVVSNWEKGNHVPDYETIDMLCKIFEVTPNEMFGWESNQRIESYIAKKQNILIEIEKLNKVKDQIDSKIEKYEKELNEL